MALRGGEGGLVRRVTTIVKNSKVNFYLSDIGQRSLIIIVLGVTYFLHAPNKAIHHTNQFDRLPGGMMLDLHAENINKISTS